MKSTIKKATNLLFIIIVFPLIIINLFIKLINKKGIFLFATQALSLIPGTVGSYARIAFNQFSMTFCHREIVIGFNTLFSQQDTEIYQGVYIGPQCNIGSCIINKHTLIASGVHIMSGKGQHNFTDLNTLIQQQGGEFEKISIGEDTWIGNGCLIMANIGNKCIIGAGSVVTKDIPDYSIAIGNPAKVIKSRLE